MAKTMSRGLRWKAVVALAVAALLLALAAVEAGAPAALRKGAQAQKVAAAQAGQKVQEAHAMMKFARAKEDAGATAAAGEEKKEEASSSATGAEAAADKEEAKEDLREKHKLEAKQIRSDATVEYKETVLHAKEDLRDARREAREVESQEVTDEDVESQSCCSSVGYYFCGCWAGICCGN